MPNQPKTVAHTVRVEDELWQAAAVEANRRGESLSEAVRRFLKRYSRANLPQEQRAAAGPSGTVTDLSERRS